MEGVEEVGDNAEGVGENSTKDRPERKVAVTCVETKKRTEERKSPQKLVWLLSIVCLPQLV